MSHASDPSIQKPVQIVTISPPPPEQRVQRQARFASPDDKKTRYSLPWSLQSHSPVGYRERLPMTRAQAEQAAALLSLERPTAFVDGPDRGHRGRALRGRARWESCPRASRRTFAGTGR